MSVPSLITVPDSCPESIVMTMTHVVGRTSSPFTLEEQSFKWPGEQWAIDFNLPPQITREVASQWIAFGLKVKGSFNNFLMGDPSAKIPMGIATGTPQVDGNNQTGDALLTKGWTPSTQNILKAGDYIQLGSGLTSRLHMILDDVSSEPGGGALLSISPTLRYSPTNNATITVINPRGVFRMVDNAFSWNVVPAKIYRMSFRAQEVL